MPTLTTAPISANLTSTSLTNMAPSTSSKIKTPKSKHKTPTNVSMISQRLTSRSPSPNGQNGHKSASFRLATHESSQQACQEKHVESTAKHVVSRAHSLKLPRSSPPITASILVETGNTNGRQVVKKVRLGFVLCLNIRQIVVLKRLFRG